MHSFQIQTHISTKNSKLHERVSQHEKARSEKPILAKHKVAKSNPPHLGSLFIFSLDHGIHSNVYARKKNKKSKSTCIFQQ